MTVRQAKTQISLGMRPVWSESSLCAHWLAKDPSFLHMDIEDSDQTEQMPRLIWVFTGCTVILLVLSWGGSNVVEMTIMEENIEQMYRERHNQGSQPSDNTKRKSGKTWSHKMLILEDSQHKDQLPLLRVWWSQCKQNKANSKCG